MYGTILTTLMALTLLLMNCQKDREILYSDETDKYITAPIEADFSYIADPEARWKAYDIKNYVITQRRDCFCPYRGPFKLFVINNEIQDALDVAADTLLSDEMIKNIALLTIDELFELTRQLSGDSLAFLEIKYDERFGYPALIRVDVDRRIIDEEYSYSTAALAKITGVRK